ncbi:hypothetical protein CP97_13370 [Aurantiacibacter atlanticus]|uniref:Ubiquinol-cytochrome c chaperone domain-containing protein n=1 Tax=Aurantiacibacter atlanticus TaxID=1648404 RepID=A0A0H4VDP5_9SPHN|nr:ubiquinol-cytochrome C chaperone family protein [Aurantiacibacter atlanticus]AKQ42807.1 hypothetical protein CP97_13370 [Aurantiacibacter atlanticus]MDF1835327.1 ubiquinol-cytochrome C chaperone family protein [Alteraurantiacibacter sp. bin_em_oilr2.035]
MSIFKRLLRRREHTELRPLWHSTVATSREEDWYLDCLVEDTLDGRFDMISLVLSLVLLRMEQSERLGPKTGQLTELFIADMDRQLRDSGVGDLRVGKNMGKLMSALGGRLGSLRSALANPEDAELAEVLARNMRLTDEDSPPLALAARARALNTDLAEVSDDALLAGTLRP